MLVRVPLFAQTAVRLLHVIRRSGAFQAENGVGIAGDTAQCTAECGLATKGLFWYTYSMLPNLPHRANLAFRALVATLGIAAVAVLIPALVPADAPTQALIARRKTADVWVVIEEREVASGATVQPDVNVVFHVPLTVERIGREILLGGRGKDVRYWGYCYPENYDPAITDKRTGLKGLFFLSEKERAIREADAQAAQPKFGLGNLPSRDDISRAAARPQTEIRHQIDSFKGGQLCYIMSEAPLPIGLDDDGDRLNNKLEKDLNTDPDVDDTDADAILDGIEVRTGTDPLQRDSDADGLIDGIEDANWNGIIDAGETDPRSIDFDRDGLCDGQCRKRLSNGQILYIGEDRNLNGVVDEGETDPRLKDTDGDGILDLQEYLICLTQGVRVCQ